jgi:hypothetical protein
MSETAQVVVLRGRPAGFEVLVVRRGGGSFGFPGGAIIPNEDPRVAAARVLFEDAGILLGRDSGEASATLEMPSLPALRRKIIGSAAGAGANATEALRAAGFTWASEALLQWSQWISPSSTGLSSPGIRIDGASAAQGSSVKIFVAELPAGFKPTFEKTEAVEAEWILPSDAELRADELLLAPHAVRTCWELQHFDKLVDVLAASRARAAEPHPILPRMGPNLVLMLPWDPDYASGQGESMPLSYHPKWAHGPSRFVREDRTWKLVGAPGSKRKA